MLALVRAELSAAIQRIAQVLEARFPEICETQPELVAHHYTEVGLTEQAIPYWQRAGQRALQHSANPEAVAHLSKGLGLLKTLPETPERTRQELMLQMALASPLMVTKGYVAPELEHVYTRARELCQQVGETPERFQVLRGLWIFYAVRAALDTARELGEQLLSLAQHVQDPALLLEAHLALGTTLFFGGEFVPARAHLDQGMALYDPQQHRSHTLLYGQDPGGMSLAFAAWTLWHLGYPAQALQRIQEALSLAQELSHPYSLAFALALGARLYQLRREGPAAQAQAEASIRLCAEQGFAQFLSQGTILRGWALAAQGQGPEGIIQMHQGLTAWRTTGAELVRPYYLALVAEAYGHVGQAEEGLRLVAEALVAAEYSGERFYESELYRLKGEFLLALPTGNHAEAESCFHQALDIARRQQAKSLELRAATSLSRLWQRLDKRAEARQLLAETYGWFTEGFDTADLQEARALLEGLT